MKVHECGENDCHLCGKVNKTRVELILHMTEVNGIGEYVLLHCEK